MGRQWEGVAVRVYEQDKLTNLIPVCYLDHLTSWTPTRELPPRGMDTGVLTSSVPSFPLNAFHPLPVRTHSSPLLIHDAEKLELNRYRETNTRKAVSFNLHELQQRAANNEMINHDQEKKINK